MKITGISILLLINTVAWIVALNWDNLYVSRDQCDRYYAVEYKDGYVKWIYNDRWNAIDTGYRICLPASNTPFGSRKVAIERVE